MRAQVRCMLYCAQHQPRAILLSYIPPAVTRVMDPDRTEGANANDDDASLHMQNSHPPLSMIDVAQMDSDFGLAQPHFSFPIPVVLNIFPPCGAYHQSSVQGCPVMPTIALIQRPTFATDHLPCPMPSTPFPCGRAPPGQSDSFNSVIVIMDQRINK